MQSNSSKASALGMIPPQVYLYVIGIPVVVGVAYFGVVRPILKSVGVFKTPESKEMEKVNDSMWVGKYWSPIWHTINGGVTLSDYQARNYAKTLYDATWGWGTDEEAIYGVFEQLGSKGNVSKVAEAYARSYDNASLMETLKSELDSEEALALAQKITNFQ